MFHYTVYCFTIGLDLETRILALDLAHLAFPFTVVVTVRSIQFQGLFTLWKFDSASTAVADRSETDARAKRTTFQKHT